MAISDQDNRSYLLFHHHWWLLDALFHLEDATQPPYVKLSHLCPIRRRQSSRFTEFPIVVQNPMLHYLRPCSTENLLPLGLHKWHFCSLQGTRYQYLLSLQPLPMEILLQIEVPQGWVFMSMKTAPNQLSSKLAIWLRHIILPVIKHGWK